MKSEEQGLVTQLVEALRGVGRQMGDAPGERCFCVGTIPPGPGHQPMCDRARAALARATPDAMRRADAAPEMYEALLDVEAGLGDRLLAKGPLSPEYAHAVLHKLRAAKARAEGRS